MSLAVWSRNLKCSRNSLIEIIMTNTAWISLCWIVWQLISRSLWLIWCYRYMLMTNCDRYVRMSVWSEGQFSWYWFTDDCPTCWSFIWHLRRSISLTLDCCCMNHVAVTINIVDVGCVFTTRVGHINRLVCCLTVDDLLSNLLNAWHIASNYWYVVMSPFRY